MSKKKSEVLPSINGQHLMNWMELSNADDYASMITVDTYLGFTTHKMTDFKVRLPERVRLKYRDVILQFQKDLDYDQAFLKLTEDEKIIKRTLSQDVRFKNHVFRYLLLFDYRSGIEIRPCWRYASENHIGAAIFSTKDWERGSKITTLIGCIAELNIDEERAFLKHQKNDFSVMYSSRKNCSQLWLGPASFVNHDCKPNCKFTINCDGDARMSLEVKNPVKAGDEVFIYYGNHFFDVNNSMCECFTCELLGQGYFSPNNEKSDKSPQKENDNRFLRKRANTIDDITQFLPKKSILNPTFTGLNGFLPKGSTTGFAAKVVSKAYSLRHTNSRLDRVKAQIYEQTNNYSSIFSKFCGSLSTEEVKASSETSDSKTESLKVIKVSKPKTKNSEKKPIKLTIRSSRRSSTTEYISIPSYSNENSPKQSSVDIVDFTNSTVNRDILSPNLAQIIEPTSSRSSSPLTPLPPDLEVMSLNEPPKLRPLCLTIEQNQNSSLPPKISPATTELSILTETSISFEQQNLLIYQSPQLELDSSNNSPNKTLRNGHKRFCNLTYSDKLLLNEARKWIPLNSKRKRKSTCNNEFTELHDNHSDGKLVKFVKADYPQTPPKLVLSQLRRSNRCKATQEQPMDLDRAPSIVSINSHASSSTQAATQLDYSEQRAPPTLDQEEAFFSSKQTDKCPDLFCLKRKESFDSVTNNLQSFKPYKLVRSRSLDLHSVDSNMDLIICMDRLRWPTQPPRITFWGHEYPLSLQTEEEIFDEDFNSCSSLTAPGLAYDSDSEKTALMKIISRPNSESLDHATSSSPKTFVANPCQLNNNSPFPDCGSSGSKPPILCPIIDDQPRVYLQPPRLVPESESCRKGSRCSAPPVFCESFKCDRLLNELKPLSKDLSVASNKFHKRDTTSRLPDSKASSSSGETVRLTLKLKKTDEGSYYCTDLN